MIVFFAVFALALLLPAGKIDWMAGWIYLILFFGFVCAVTYWLYRNDPGLLNERMAGSTQSASSNQKQSDKFLMTLTAVFFFAWLILMPLDAVRFGWSHVPLWLQFIGGILLTGSFILFFLVFRENTYLSPAVRVQTERGQTVISTGRIITYATRCTLPRWFSSWRRRFCSDPGLGCFSPWFWWGSSPGAR